MDPSWVKLYFLVDIATNPESSFSSRVLGMSSDITKTTRPRFLGPFWALLPEKVTVSEDRLI